MSEVFENSPVQTCRLCLAQTTIFFSLTKEDEISAMLEALTALRIAPTDVISTVMCLKCRLNLKLAFKIQQNMLHAEQRFYDRVKTEIEVSDHDLTAHDFTESDSEKDGVVSNTSQNYYPCDICGKDTYTKSNLRKHKYSVHSGRQKSSKEIKAPNYYPCDICGKDTYTKTNLTKHKYNVHKGSKCPICDKVITQTNLKRHIDRHTDPDSVCELCGATCKKQDLRIHMYRHSKSKVKCQYCDKSYSTKTHLRNHEKKDHFDVADFICDTCGRKFYKSCDLKRHINITHLKLRPFICDFCKVGFSSRHALKTHRRQHTNETPYKCDVCGDGFRQKVSLKAHLKSKHNIEDELTTECTKCGKKFASKAALTAHSRVHIS